MKTVLDNFLRYIFNFINFWVGLTFNFLILINLGKIISVFSGLALQSEKIKTLNTVSLITYWFIPYLFTTMVLVYIFIKYLKFSDVFFVKVIKKVRTLKK